MKAKPRNLVFAAGALALACGTQSVIALPSNDADTADDATTSADATIFDGGADSFDPDVIRFRNDLPNSGDCGADFFDGETISENRGCCDGVRCIGSCVSAFDRDGSFCECSGVLGGCPAGLTCCRGAGEACTLPEKCAGNTLPQP